MKRVRSIVAPLACALLLLGCGRYNKSGFVYWSLSPEANNLAFSWCGYEESLCTIALYTFKTGELKLFRNTTGRNWSRPNFSSDGRQLVFSIATPDSDDRQIAVMNSDGSGLRVVTQGKGYRTLPAFSNDGKKLTYLCAGGMTEKYWTPYKGSTRRLRDKEICVVDLLTGQENKITSLGAYAYSRPSFMSDGKKVLFHYKGGKKNPDTKKTNTFEFNIAQHIEKPKSETVLSEMPLANNPRISNDGRRVVFSARSNEMDRGKLKSGYFNYDLFLWEGSSDILNSKGTIRRLTRAQSYLSGYALSMDGRKI
ncbi:MAG: hypothetical protein QGH73_15875, partial [Rhodospirillales bacterium]|nr:hypothetical protein [Rhodospirillales bacterium]